MSSSHGRGKWSLLRRELLRKAVHCAGVLVLIISRIIGTHIVILSLCTVVFLYLVSEYMRLKGRVFGLSYITIRLARENELNSLVYKPLSLAVSVILLLAFFPPRIYEPAIILVTVCDSLATIVGITIGRHKLPLTKKSLEGTLAFTVSSVLLLHPLIRNPSTLLVLSLVTAVVEAYTPIDDNVAVPIAAVLMLSLFACT